MEVTLFTDPHYVVAVVWVGVVVEVYEGPEVLSVEKSGSKSIILIALSPYQAECQWGVIAVASCCHSKLQTFHLRV